MKELTQSDELALAIGKVTMAWNGAHEVLLMIFISISGMKNPVAERLFLARRSDRDQRAMLLQVAELVFSDNGNLPKYDELERLVARLDKLAKKRNTSVHTMWHGLLLGSGDSFRVIMTPRSSSPLEIIQRLEKPAPNYSVEFRQLAADIQALALELFDFHLRLHPRSEPEEAEPD
jgi:hypothetical protein